MAIRASIHKLVLTAASVLALAACSSDRTITAPPPPPPSVLLKDVIIDRLPSPYYHFDYDADSRISGASFASGLTSYDLVYDGGRLSEMRDNNNVLGNRDRLVYVYDDAGRVASVKYTDGTGVVFTVLFFTYNGQQLTKLERDRRVTGGFIIDKTMSFSYYPDGNLFELTEHRPAIDGVQVQTTTIDQFAGYDDKINVDAFNLIHDEFFDHLVLLPGVQLQKGNPAHVTHTGDGDNYTVDYTYTYDRRNRPVASSGDLAFLTGPDAGQHFPLSTTFSYYD
jgi:hypothetical protein